MPFRYYSTFPSLPRGNDYLHDRYHTVADQIATEYRIDRSTFKGSDVQKILKSKGFDGLILLDSNSEAVVANAFDASQIKSATD